MSDSINSESEENQEEQEAVVRKLPDGVELFKEIISHRGWEVRDAQLTMVENITNDILNSDAGYSDTSVMAPVGTGKTLGYAIPAIASGYKSIFCTSNRALQDQIITKDGPELTRDIKELYNYDISFSLLKGKSNYACPDKIDAVINHGIKGQEDDSSLFEDLIDTPPTKSELTQHSIETLLAIKERVLEGMRNYDSVLLDVGDMLSTLPSDIRNAVSASSKCQYCSETYSFDAEDETVFNTEHLSNMMSRIPYPLDYLIENARCGYRMAYLLAMQADIVVINTSLLSAEITKSEHVPDFIPTLIRGAGVVVIDEAHHLERIITESMSQTIETERIRSRADKILKQSEKIKTEKYKNYIKSASNATLAMCDGIESATKRTDFYKSISNNRQIMMDALTVISEYVESGRGTPDAESKEYRRIKHIRFSIYDLVDEITEFYGKLSKRKYDEFFEDDRNGYNLEWRDDDNGYVEATLTPFDLSFFRGNLANEMSKINYFYISTALNTLNPVVSDKFVNYGSGRNSSLIMCSGTITKNTITTVGMNADSFFTVPSPFDPMRSRMYVPSGLPNPNDDDYMYEAYDVIKSSIEASNGGTMVLTTSYMAITGKVDRYGNEVYEGWAPMIERDFGDEYKVLVQGNGMSRAEIIEEFKSDPNSILIATLSFWEGVDIPGDSLRQVILHKAPFPTQDDATFSTRSKWVEEHGGNPFNDVTINYAQIHLGQGAGRLIRAESDLGGIVLLDSRYWDARYGKKLLRLLPQDMPITSSKRAYNKWMRWVADNPGSDSSEMPELSSYWASISSHDSSTVRTKRRRRTF